MRKLLILTACGLLIALALGCSDDKKEEAQRLEQEMLGGGQQTDTTQIAETTPSARPGDSTPTAPGRPEAIPKETVKPIGLPSQPIGSGYVVQIASCPSSEYAEYLVGKYQKRGYEPWVITYTGNQGDIYFRVRLGYYDTQAEADRVKRELIDRYSINPWIDRVM